MSAQAHGHMFKANMNDLHTERKQKQMSTATMTFTTHEGYEITVTYILVTPEYAQNLLERNVSTNRALRNANLQKIISALNDDTFMMNGDTIKINEHGELFDGQHRLNAIVVSGTPAWLLIIDGLPASAMTTVDQNMTRSAVQILTTTGREMKNATLCVAIQRVLFMADESPKVRAFGNDRRRIAEAAWQNRDQLERWAYWSRSLLESSTNFTISPSHPFSRGRREALRAANPSALGGLAVIMVEQMKCSEEGFKTFWSGIVTGLTGDEVTMAAAKAVRRHLTDIDPLIMKGGGNQVSLLMQQYDTLIRTYNRWVRREKITRVNPTKNLSAIRLSGDLTSAIRGER